MIKDEVKDWKIIRIQSFEAIKLADTRWFIKDGNKFSSFSSYYQKSIL
jgi:hypothetical protein